MLSKNISTKRYGDAVSVCPGPNLAYFDKVMSLKEISDHIYGRDNMINRTDRPNMFVNEIKMYIKHLKKSIGETPLPFSPKQLRYFNNFKKNLNSGIDYYLDLISRYKSTFEKFNDSFEKDILMLRAKLNEIAIES